MSNHFYPAPNSMETGVAPLLPAIELDIIVYWLLYVVASPPVP